MSGEDFAHVEFARLRPEAEYFERLAAGAIPYQRCLACGHSVFFPRVLCPACGATRLEWRQCEGAGTVYSATAVHVRNGDPYVVALVDLDEGIRVMTRIDDAEPEPLPIGRAVTLTAGELDGQPALRATLAEVGG